MDFAQRTQTEVTHPPSGSTLLAPSAGGVGKTQWGAFMIDVRSRSGVVAVTTSAAVLALLCRWWRPVRSRAWTRSSAGVHGDGGEPRAGARAAPAPARRAGSRARSARRRPPPGTRVRRPRRPRPPAPAAQRRGQRRLPAHRLASARGSRHGSARRGGERPAGERARSASAAAARRAGAAARAGVRRRRREPERPRTRAPAADVAIAEPGGRRARGRRAPRRCRSPGSSSLLMAMRRPRRRSRAGLALAARRRCSRMSTVLGGIFPGHGDLGHRLARRSTASAGGASHRPRGARDRDQPARRRAAPGAPGPRARLARGRRRRGRGRAGRRRRSRAAAGFLAHFDPKERHEVRAASDARLLLSSAPWPGEGPPEPTR